MKTILIFEDDYDLAQQWSLALEAEGHAVDIATNMEIAEALCKKRNYDLAIIDLFIVDEDGNFDSQGGITLMQYMRQPALKGFHEHYRLIPKVAVSGSRVVNHFDMLRVAEDSGCNITLRKPFGNSELVDEVNQLLRQRDAQKGLEAE